MMWAVMADLEEKQMVSQLLDVYGALLTDRQRDFLDLHYNEDLSYGEIAEGENISRQAVHDTIHHGKKALFRFEEHLHLLDQPRRQTGAFPDKERIEEELTKLAALLRDDIIYNVKPLRRTVQGILDLLGN
jgi:predicted DNA-binding protein YlxM (UPF0122 family)